MSKLLYINACFTDDSRTKVLADAVLKKWDGEIEEVKLNDGSIKALTKDQLAKRVQLQEAGDFSDEMFKYAKQFASADAIVIAAPYWDLSFPASYILSQYRTNQSQPKLFRQICLQKNRIILLQLKRLNLLASWKVRFYKRHNPLEIAKTAEVLQPMPIKLPA